MDSIIIPGDLTELKNKNQNLWNRSVWTVFGSGAYVGEHRWAQCLWRGQRTIHVLGIPQGQRFDGDETRMWCPRLCYGHRTCMYLYVGRCTWLRMHKWACEWRPEVSSALAVIVQALSTSIILFIMCVHLCYHSVCGDHQEIAGVRSLLSPGGLAASAFPR